VWSQLDADTLRKMVNNTDGGRYLNVSTGTFDLGAIYTQLVASAEKKDLESKTIERYEERFQIFLGLALLFLAAEFVIPERTRTKS
jgi:Ca-activated chloride channel family protein